MISDKIRKLRIDNEMTQEELAKRVGTTKQAIFKYETGIVTNIPLDKLEKIANALNTTTAYLMGWEQEPAESSTIDQALIAAYGGDIKPEDVEKIKDYIAYVMGKKNK